MGTAEWWIERIFAFIIGGGLVGIIGIIVGKKERNAKAKLDESSAEKTEYEITQHSIDSAMKVMDGMRAWNGSLEKRLENAELNLEKTRKLLDNTTKDLQCMRAELTLREKYERHYLHPLLDKAGIPYADFSEKDKWYNNLQTGGKDEIA